MRPAPEPAFATPLRGAEAPSEQQLVDRLRAEGFVRLEADAMRSLLGAAATSWNEFAATWDDLGLDRYMADGGRYRRRRHAVFHVSGGRIDRLPHQPHFQSRDYNPLNGGVERWFEAVLAATARHPILRRVLGLCDAVFTAAETGGGPQAWRVEIHQFRIEAAEGIGHPTPEGFHRDGVDWVFVMLVDRRNVDEGVTEIGRADGASLGRFTLTNPGDAVLLDDRRVLHGVTPIRPAAPVTPAHRDVLVATFTAT